MAELSINWYVKTRPEGKDNFYVAGYEGTSFECNGNGKATFI